MTRSRFPIVVTYAVLAFFYLPILVLVINSFNASRFGSTWGGWSLRWYERLFTHREIWEALQNTLVVAVAATAASVVLGTLAAFALHRWQSRLQRVHFTLIYIPLVVPEILMGISLLFFFAALRMPLGLGTITLAHITFCVSYVALVVLGRLQDFDWAVVEAAQDLGAGWWTTVRRVLLPLLAPGIVAGALLAFTLSVDDFVITFFVAGPGSTTLPIQIYSMIKHGSPPVINALSTLLLAATFAAVWLSRRLTEENR
ncbi:MAG TPA: ABC transporter permease [Acidobacteriota bacterium]|nr:ABC transporter permease [Acidobacteriota bacterium]HOT01518.1 ABC transporter permease [Acidobacteriota bacterium]HQF88091.1 ABC transporter permease [Acidobacteriota bacterium]HQG92099.1 ABC transporter permease [Acidobacteriota bacterium]HQK88282.1 ABC transporter permease [Acidobacteriota bacterium]